MRFLLLALVALSGCVVPRTTTTTIPTQRLLMAPTPLAPVTFAGGSGLALGLALLPVSPTRTTSTGAVAHSVAQPELNGVLQVGGNTAVSARAAFATPTLGVQAQATRVSVPANAGAFDGSLGVGHDFAAPSRRWGAAVSVELGLVVNTLIVATSSGPDVLTTLLSPTVRGAAGLWGTVGPEVPGSGAEGVPALRAIRLYGGLSVGTLMSNDSTGTRTTTCSSGCTVSETGATSLGAAMMVGAGARWQVTPFFSLGLEGWAVMHNDGAQVPFVGSLMLRLGNFETTPRRPKKDFVPLEPPAWEEAAPPIVPPPV